MSNITSRMHSRFWRYARSCILILSFVLGTVIIPDIAYAEESAADFFHDYDAAPPNRKVDYENELGYINAGFGWANAHLGNHGQKKLFCEPDNLAINGPQLADILRHYLKKFAQEYINQGIDTSGLNGHVLEIAPVGSNLLLALQDTFPCVSQNRDKP